MPQAVRQIISVEIILHIPIIGGVMTFRLLRMYMQMAMSSHSNLIMPVLRQLLM